MRAAIWVIVCWCVAAPAAAQTLEGFGFGVGLAWSHDRDFARVTDATIDEQGIVRVRAIRETFANLALETHYFVPVSSFLGVGPFVMAQPGEDDMISRIGFGGMIGLRRGSSEQSFNIGVGVVYDIGTETLAPGFVDGQRAPESAIRYVQRDLRALLGLFSFSWN